jgi:hypothetical protein
VERHQSISEFESDLYMLFPPLQRVDSIWTCPSSGRVAVSPLAKPGGRQPLDAAELPFMKTSTAASVREQIAAAPVDTFIHLRDIDGPPAVVRSALSRVAAEKESPVLHVRRGLYWRTEWTRFGPRRPGLWQIVFEITAPGTGPASVAAAHALGATTQVPGVAYFAVPGRPPRPVWGTRFFPRQHHRSELALRPLEVAVLETVAACAAVVEIEWPDYVERIDKLATAGHIRLDVLRTAAQLEHDHRIRRQFDVLDDEISNGTPARARRSIR